MLGTVQFGMDYGVANTHEKTDYDTVKNILKEAFYGGVNTLDTAPEYGKSEEVIGTALNEFGLLNKFNTVTKIPAIPKDCNPEKFIEESLKSSLKRLQQEVIPVALIHVEADGIYLDILKCIKDKWLIKAAGISLNTLTHKDDGENTDCLQVLCSILDHRVDHCFDHGNRHGFIRGAYLQGMLLMPEKGVFVSKILEKRSKLGELVIPMAELALCNLFAKPCCKSVLTGVKTYERLWKNLRISQLTPLSNVELSAVKKIVFPALEEICVSPFM